MSDVHAAVAAESSPAPASEVAVDLPNPITTEATPEPEVKAEPKPAKVEAKADKPLSAREALEKASLKVEKDNPKVEVKDAKPEKAEPVKVEAKRDETGKFAAKEPVKVEAKEAAKVEPAKPSYTADDPPTRFTDTAKAKWAAADPEIRGETQRAIRELTQGYEKHKASAEAFESYRELEEIAKQSGKKGADVFREYYNMEQHLQKDLVGGLDAICQKLGVSFKDVAAHVMGQTPDQNASRQEADIRALKAKIDQLEGQLGGVTQTFQKQQETATQGEVEKFAAAEGHERFEELASDIAFFLKTRCPGDLTEAYKLAERLNPAPAKQPDPAASSAAVIDLSAQTEKGQKSINGSPSAGSSPAAQKPSSTIKEALRRAQAQAG